MKMKFGRPYRGYIRRRPYRGPSIGLLALLGMAALVFVLVWAAAALRPTIERVAQSKLEAVAVTAIHTAVRDTFAQQAVGYDDLMTVSRDESGHVTAVTANPATVNQIKSDLSLQILNSLSQAGEVGVRIPAGSLTGSALLSGMGPGVGFHFVPYGSVDVDFHSTFTEAGINQTRQEVFLDVKTRVSAILPGFSADADVQTSVLVAQTLIVGSVPEHYANVGSAQPDGTGVENYLFDLLE